MNALNQVILEGNVVRAATRKETPTGRYVCTLPIAVNRTYKAVSGDTVNEVGYYDIQAWGDKFCDLIESQGFKGRGVRIVGRLKQDRWTSKDGKATSKIYIVAEHVDFKFANTKKNSFNDAEEKAELLNNAQAFKGLQEEAEIPTF